MEAVIAHIEHPFAKGDLTATGVQYSDEVTSAKNVYSTVEEVAINPPLLGRVIEIEFGITWSMKSSGTTNKATGLVQARNKGGTWVDLMTAVENTAASTDAQEHTFSGRFELEDDFNRLPFELRVRVKSAGATDNALGKMKNTSYVRVVYSGAL